MSPLSHNNILLLQLLCEASIRTTQEWRRPCQYTGTSFDLKPVPHEGLEEQVVGLESEEKEGDLDYERYKIIK